MRTPFSTTSPREEESYKRSGETSDEAKSMDEPLKHFRASRFSPINALFDPIYDPLSQPSCVFIIDFTT